jgi:hypothetical protein
MARPIAVRAATPSSNWEFEMRRILHTSSWAVLSVIAVAVSGCVDEGTNLEVFRPEDPSASVLYYYDDDCPNCGERRLTPEEHWDIQNAIEDRRGCPEIVDHLLGKLASNEIWAYEQEDGNWGSTVHWSNGTTTIYVWDGHWAIEDEDEFWAELEFTVIHEGIHSYTGLDDDNPSFSDYQIGCWAA